MANNAQDLLQLCEQYPDEATGYLVRQDLEKWLAYIGNYDVAECAANARQIDTGDRQKLEEFLNKCHSLNEPKPVPAATTETSIADNMTPAESGEPIMEVPPKWTESAALNSQKAATETVESSKSSEVVKATPDSTTSAETVTTPKPEQASESAASAKTEPVKMNSNSINSDEKPSFFQVVAKFIVKILYRDKA